MSRAISEIPLTDIQAEIRWLAAESPDFVYPREGNGCLYVECDGSGELVGSCIVGQALINLGVTPEIMQTHEQQSAFDILQPDVTFRVDADPIARWIDRVQDYQDIGRAWGDAVERGDELTAGDNA